MKKEKEEKARLEKEKAEKKKQAKIEKEKRQKEKLCLNLKVLLKMDINMPRNMF